MYFLMPVSRLYCSSVTMCQKLQVLQSRSPFIHLNLLLLFIFPDTHSLPIIGDHNLNLLVFLVHQASKSDTTRSLMYPSNKKYFCLPNKRPGRNKRPWWKILKTHRYCFFQNRLQMSNIKNYESCLFLNVLDRWKSYLTAITVEP